MVSPDWIRLRLYPVLARMAYLGMTMFANRENIDTIFISRLAVTSMVDFFRRINSATAAASTSL
jgi:hypothetical protein